MTIKAYFFLDSGGLGRYFVNFQVTVKKAVGKETVILIGVAVC